MNYRLICLTDGRGLLNATLATFLAQVTPMPAEVYIHGDSEAGVEEAEEAAALFPSAAVGGDGRHRGFCKSVRECWEEARDPGVDFIYWLEDDFLHTRDVDLRMLALVLELEPQVAQLSLCRNAVNREELAAGGLIASRPGQYTPRLSEGFPWLEHRAYWTTNPSLFRRDLAVEETWPTRDRCEGIFTHDLLARRPGTTFGVWGSGEEWVQHVGDRAGKGY